MNDATNITLDGAILAGQIFIAGIVISFAVRWIARRLLLWRDRGPSAANVFSRVIQWIICIIAFMAAATVVFPSVRPVDILGGITIISIAAGIAFQTVLGSMFAGLVILARDRYRVGDQIGVQDVKGEVTSIGSTSTSIRTFDGRLVVLPNTVLHSEVVTVRTGYEKVRTSVVIALDAATDLSLARRTAVEAASTVPTVYTSPAPQAHLISVGTGTVDMEVRFWSGARQLDTVAARSEVIEAVLVAFREAGVATGSDSITVERPEPGA
ncbi:mechanosensitive ion channel family protein [uncultured Corynebacterium sp.]|uniref:mechanosensitive ion channel family protein n=1 Tax=uncultured Corynebacterium sp. TaxID=159447 RepID=UPI0025D93B78|nr:mechanosensitive ion channel domain-containing protein [uncultured Corynebacterium sp.]